MLNVLVVDDEPKHRRGLSRMLEHLRPEYNIYCAMDGKEALQNMEVYPIDLVFTDIQMPIMDGLEFLEELSRLGGEESVVIMSAYSEFEYAQRAIQFGAWDYLLKPIEEQKIEQLLTKAEQNVRAVRKASLESSLSELFDGTPEKEDFRIIDKSFPSFSSGLIIAADFHSKEDTNDPKLLLYELKEQLEQVISDLGFACAYYMPDKILFTLITSSMSESPIMSTQLKEILNGLIYHFSVEYDAELTFGLGDYFSRWEHEAKNAYVQATQSLQSKFYKGGGTLLEADLISFASNRCIVRLDVGALTKAVISGDKTLINYHIDLALHEVMEEGYPNPKNLVYSVSASIHHLASCLMEKGLVPFHNDVLEEAILRSHTVEELKKAARAWVYELVDRINNRKQNRNESIIECCKTYIESNYNEDLSLNELATKFHFNPSYFCLLFKTHTKTTINQYILETRMKEAERMLLETSLKIYEISVHVGYKDVKYFIRLFRKVFGTSPEEYRHISILAKG